MKEEWEKTLDQLKYPLTFFGLTILVMESAFAGILLVNSFPVLVVIYIVSWMGIIFLASIFAVFFLTYKVPKHLMLEPQLSIDREDIELNKLRSMLEETIAILRKPATKLPPDSEPLKEAIKKINGIMGNETG